MNGSERWKPWFGPAALIGGLIIAVIGGAVVVLVAQGGAAAHTTQLSPGETDVATLIQDLAFVGVAVALAQTVGRVRRPSSACARRGTGGARRRSSSVASWPSS